MRHRFSCFFQLLRLLLTFPLKRTVLIGSPEHGNLGDQAISIAERKLLKQNNIRCAEISGNLYRRLKKLIKPFVKKNDAIGITGGGFLGSLWKLEDDMVNDIILTFKKNKIVIFPQTLFFDNDDDKLNFVKIYSTHNNLHIFLRENNSFSLVQSILGDNFKAYLVPDMVLSLDTNDIAPERKNTILLCLREDKESVLSENSKKYIRQFAEKENCDVKSITTNIPHRQILFEKRDNAVKEILTEIKSSRLMITDRLHAMIFAYITGTPCYVFDNLSRKVSGVYEWIKDCGFIKLVSNISEITFENDFSEQKVDLKGWENIVEVIKNNK
ncbi:MAG: polysaccharide pyruvyl transferase family protein [Bacteroidales bacterium]|nr:polysaccharide pyruvyl transferase family protein [Bacteroidales bacterium]